MNDPDDPLRDTDDARTLAVLSVPPRSRVLDVGGGGGPAVARALAGRGCAVCVLAPDDATARALRPHAARTLVGDPDTADLETAVGADGPFDAAVLLGTLAHVRDPAGLLRRVAAALGPGGRIVAGVPNVAHGAIRLALLRGRFRAPGGGDRDVLHVFDSATARAVFEEAGLDVAEQLKVIRRLDDSEAKVDPACFPEEVLREVTADPEALVSDWVLVGVPARGTPTVPTDATLAERLQAKADELTARVAAAEARAAALEEQAAALSGRIEQLEATAARVPGLEAELAERAARIEALEAERRHFEVDVAVKEAYVTELRQLVDDARAEVGVAKETAARAKANSEAAQAEAYLALAEARAALAEREAEVERLRARAAELDALHHRLAARANDVLHRVPVVHRPLKGAAARLAHRSRGT